MSALFSKPKVPKAPTRSEAEIEEERRRVLAEQKAGGRQETILTGGAGVTAPILGAAANLNGGALV